MVKWRRGEVVMWRNGWSDVRAKGEKWCVKWWSVEVLKCWSGEVVMWWKFQDIYMYLYMFWCTCTCTCSDVHVPVHVLMYMNMCRTWKFTWSGKRTGYMDMEMKSIALKCNATIKVTDLVWKIYRYSKIITHNFEKCNATIKSTDKDFKKNNRYDKFNRRNFEKCNVTIKSTGLVLKNVTL